MIQNNGERDRESLSIEEYLKRRQAVRTREADQYTSRAEYSVSALKLAALFYL